MEDPPQGVYNHEALYYIGKSIDVMGKVDAVYFAYDWQTARGCRIERQIAQEYGVKILEYDFLDEIKNEYQSITRVDIPTIKFDRVVDPEEYKVTCEDKTKGVEFGRPGIPKGVMPY